MQENVIKFRPEFYTAANGEVETVIGTFRYLFFRDLLSCSALILK